MASFHLGRAVNRRTAACLAGSGFALALAAREPRAVRAADEASLAANKALVHRLFAEGFNGGNSIVFEEIYAADVVDRGEWALRMPGPAGLPIGFDEFRKTLPGVTVTVDAVVAEADLVASRETWRAGHPPTGVHVVGRTMHFFRITNGQIVEQWSMGWDWIVRLDDPQKRKPGNPLLAP